MTIVNNRTSGRNWPLPNKSNLLKDDVQRLTSALIAADEDVTDILLELGLKASFEHEHEIGEIIGLMAVLNGKMPAGFHDTLDGLTDVSVFGAASGQVLIKQGTGWIPISLQPGNIAGLEALLAGKATAADIAALKNELLGGAGAAFDTLGELAELLGNDPNFTTTLATALGLRVRADAAQAFTSVQQAQARANTGLTDGWACQPVGVPIAVSDDLVGVTSPLTNQPYRFIKLTALDAYNSGILVSEAVSGSAPMINATAVISLTGSPLNGRTVRLINTERRFLRAGSAGVIEDSANLSHIHTAAVSSDSHTHKVYYDDYAGFQNGTAVRGVPSNQSGSDGSVTTTSDAHTHTVTIAANGDTEARPRNMGVTYYMRVK